MCGINNTNRSFHKVEITVILVACTSLGILMTSSPSGARVNPLVRSTVVSWVVFILWMGRASSHQQLLITHMIHIIIMFSRKVGLQPVRRHLAMSNLYT